MAGMTLNVDPNLVQPIIEAEIQAAIVRQLGQSQNLIPNMVQAALQQKVNYQGNISDSSYENKYPYIEVLCNQAIQKVTKDAMMEYIAEAAPIIQAEVAKQIRAQSTGIAKTFVEGLASAIKTEWSFKVQVTLPQRD